MSDVIESPDHAVHVAEKLRANGLNEEWEVILPLSNQLFIDYDQKSLPKIFYDTLDILVQSYKGKVTYVVSQSKSGNRHVIVYLPVHIDQWERVAWQAVFGSDLKREALTLRSMAKRLLNPNLLIERKNGKGILFTDTAKRKQLLLDTGD